MATQCLHCGKELPREDARFCSNCGTLVPWHPLSPRYKATSDPAISSASSPATPAQEGKKPPLREQIAQQPSSRPQSETPRWMSRVEKSGTHKDGTPAPITRVSVVEDAQSQKSTEAEPVKEEPIKEELPAPVVTPRPPVLNRELHVKVWEQDDPDLLADLELLPTEPLAELSPEAPVEDVVEETIEDQPTRPMLASPASSLPTVEPELPVTPALTAAPAVSIVRESTAPPTGRAQNSHSMQHSTSNSPNIAPFGEPERAKVATAVSTANPMSIAPLSVPMPSPVKSTRARLLFMVTAILLLILVLGGLGVWTVVFHPFSVAPVTQPWQSFSDSGLGLSLQYPNGWQTQVDRGKSTLSISDSSHTGQVYITVMNTSTNDLIQTLQQQAAQAAMAGGKVGTPLSFAGASWQQIQGTVQQSGANYTEVIFVTIHGNHLFKIAQLAPLSTYASEESLCFAPMRASFHFL